MTMQLVGWAIVHSLWQGGVIALVAACLFVLARDMKSSTRYAIGLGGLALMIVLPVLTAINSTNSRASVAISAIPVSSPAPAINNAAWTPKVVDANESSLSATPTSLPSTSQNLGPSVLPRTPEPASIAGFANRIDAFIVRYFESALPWLALAWVFGLLISSAQLIGGLSRTRRITRIGVSEADDTLFNRVRDLAGRLGMTRSIRVLKSVSVDVPLVVGALRPVVVVPASLLTGLTPFQLDMLLAHELAHIRRYDFLVNLVQTVIETLLFYHPAARWLSDRVREERENCCDDVAVSVCGGDASGYTETLLVLEESRAEGYGLAAAATGGSLLRRAHRLITGRTPHVELGPRWIAGVITIAAALFTGGEAMARGVESSFAPLVVSATEDQKEDSTRKYRNDPDPARAGPGRVVKSPVGGSLDERWRWATSQSRGLGTYWVGYLIAGDQSGKSHYYADDIPIHFGQSTHISGHMMLGDDMSNIRFSGVPLAPVVGQHARFSTAIFVLFSDGITGKRIQRLRVATFAIPMYFDRRPVIWLDSASDNESLDLLQSLMSRARNEDMREELVAAMGMHRTASLVLPKLISFLQSGTESEGVRREAADWLGKTNDPRAVVALSRAVRTDRSKDVRGEAIEAFEDMPVASVTDSLIAFASTLQDHDLRRTAIESLGQREDSRALEYLTRVVRSNASEDLKSEALEAIGEMHDGRGFDTILSFARNDRDPDVRRKAVEAIAESEPASRALDVLKEIVRNETDETIRREAVETIAEVHDSRSVGILRELANSTTSSTALQIEAVESLGETIDDENALKVLADIVQNHPNPEVRMEAVETLGEFNNEIAALRLLKSVIEKDKSLDVRLKAVEALEDLNDNAGVPLLRQLAKSSPDPDVRARARDMLDEDDDDK